MSYDKQNQDIFLQMMGNVVEKLDTSEIERYLTRDFELESNRCLMNLNRYRDHLNEAFKSLRSIQLKRPLTDVIANGDKLAVRFSMTITDKIGISDDADIIAMLHFKDNKIHRWCELSYPDWQTE
ncbi:MAG: nuclear transport factor 2 family protein [Alphaproteobacteria bacterium]|jgi:hypothetical protein|nr:nuclear transport factor 2 family protein [Alphaproteobacteria bacterium]